VINVTIHFGFRGTVPIFNDVSQKTQFSRDAHLSRFGLVSRICPDLPISAVVCLRIGGQKLAESLSVYTNKSLGADAPPRPRWGSSRRSQTRKSEPDGSGLCGSHATIRTFGVRPGLRCRNSKRVVRRYIDFYCSLGCDVILTSVWCAGVGRRMAGIVRV